MGRKCSVIRCPNSSRKPLGIIHRFPVNQTLREMWTKSLEGHLKPVNGENSGICTLHFRKSDYNLGVPKRDGRNSQLFPSAIPQLEVLENQEQGALYLLTNLY